MGTTMKIALAGEGGQGVQSVAMILTEGAYESGKEAIYIPNFGVEQRGGVSVAFVQIGDEPVKAPKFKTGDIVIALSDRAIHRTSMYVGSQTVFIYDESANVSEQELPRQAKSLFAIPAIRVAKEEFHPRVFNIIILGALLGISHVLTESQARAAIEKKLGYKFEQNPSLRDMNFRALARGIELVKGLM
ncbi:MAG TPA: ketoisovalerate oxidoreductase [Clostridia bacterium]|nr:ketoisovalerate oxidoreductase [Clostridia bacterium]